MRQWSIPPEGPLCLFIAADARMCVPDYADDQIWELKLGGGDPTAISLETTYGLRARNMRIFPSFTLGKHSVTDPGQFSSPPLVKSLLPNYLKIELNPFSDLQVSAEYWVVDSRSVAGRFILTNLTPETAKLRLGLHTVLHPGDNIDVMDGITIEGVHVLVGRTGPLEPVIFLSGAAEAVHAVHPALEIIAELQPGRAKEVVWGHGGHATQQESFWAARNAATREWDAEIARLELNNVGQVEIETGDPDWDVALALAQKTALSGYVGPTPRLPHASFVATRIPDRGYSERGDGKDYGLDWEGQTAALAYVNLSQVLPAAPELAKGVIRNYLHVQGGDGSIDWKPGMGGQRSNNLCTPLLATLTWRIYAHTEDREFLHETFPGLLEFVEAWFGENRDRDQDGYPEWDQILQSGFDESPTFVPWHAWGHGLDIQQAETPDLASYLYSECRALIQIAEVIDREEAIPELKERMKRIARAVETTWTDDTEIYHHRDRDSHATIQGELLGQGKGGCTIDVGKTCDPPVRLLIRIQGSEEASKKIKVAVRGKLASGGRKRVHRFQHGDFQWFWERGVMTTLDAFATIKSIEVTGLREEHQIEVWIADYSRQDQTLLLPLWAGIPDQGRAQQLIEETILDARRFWRPFGIPSCSALDPAYEAGRSEGAGAVWMLWNTMIGEALADHGYLREAAELTSRLMSAVLASLRVEKAFRESYDPERENAFGERNHLWGTAPVHLLLYVLGVRLISPRRIWFRNQNPFPWPIRLRWRGTELFFEANQCRITFPNGEEQFVQGEGMHLVEQSVPSDEAR